MGGPRKAYPPDRASQAEGKAAAVNQFLAQAREKIVVLCSADLLPEQDTLEKLVAPFADPEIGMTTCRPWPVNDPRTFMGFAAHLLWGLHHHINANGSFKAGELIAFRKIFERIPYRTAVDEASSRAGGAGQGYRAQYVADAACLQQGTGERAGFPAAAAPHLCGAPGHPRHARLLRKHHERREEFWGSPCAT